MWSLNNMNRLCRNMKHHNNTPLKSRELFIEFSEIKVVGLDTIQTTSMLHQLEILINITER